MALTKAQLIDLNANELVIDLDADTSITADTDDQIDIKIAGADDFTFTANTFTALSGSSIVTPTLTATAATITSGAINLAAIDIDGATDIGAAVADADLFIIDDGAGGTNRKVTASRIKTYAGSPAGTLSFQATRNGDLSVSATTQTEIVYNSEITDTDSKYNVSNGRYSPATAGTYFVTASVSFAPGANVGVGASGYLKIRVNGTGTEFGQTSNQGSGDSNDESFHASAVITLDDDDYISVWWYHTATAGTHMSAQSWFSGFRIA